MLRYLRGYESSHNGETIGTIVSNKIGELVGNVMDGKWFDVIFSLHIGLDDFNYPDLPIKTTKESVDSIFTISGSMANEAKIISLSPF